MPAPNRREAVGGSRHNPFRTYSNYVYPRTIKDVLIWASWLWNRNAKYRNSISKVVSYFISSISVSQDKADGQVDSNAVEGFQDLLEDSYGCLSLILQFGEELAAMGNVFVSAERIFSRELLCPNRDCGWQMHLKSLHKGVDYEWNGREFTGICPKCGRKVTYRIKDVKSEDGDGRKIRFVFRDADSMLIQYNRLTDTYKYYYKMPDDVAKAIRRGDAVYLEDSPKVFLDAANSPDALIEFPEDSFFSMRTKTLSYLDKLYKGWGVPMFMLAFDSLLQMQQMSKFNEAVTADYIAPTRIISPQPQNLKAGLDDPNRMPMSGAMFRSFMQSALSKVKDNPTTWIVAPAPVQYQLIGGEAKQLADTDLMEWYSTQAVADMNIPQEFRMSSFQVVAPTMGLRMFERQWIHFAKGLNRFTAWMAARVSDAHGFEDMKCTLDTTSFVEDDTNKQVLLGLMQGGVISKTKVLQRFGIDFSEDIKDRIREQKEEQDAAMEMQTSMQNQEMVQSVIPPAAAPGLGQAQMNIQQMQQAAAGGMAAPEGAAVPGAPAAPAGPGAPLPFNQGASESASIEQMFQEAQNMAQQLYAAPPNIRRQQLVQLKASNPSLHAQVKQILTDMEQQVSSDAVAQSKQGAM